jgi:Na+/H+ antiporter NhaD/arsenite permease-like protein
MPIVIIIIFILGYCAIVFEHSIRINKAATALVTGVLCWAVYMFSATDKEIVTGQLIHHLGDISQILFFLMSAMAIVELIDVHDGFEIIIHRIKTTDKRKLLWIIGLFTFFLSSVLNNLTTAIVMISLVRKLISEKNERLMMTGLIIIAANAGGVWSPIGDVTTTMLWIGGQITASGVVIKLIIPGLVCLFVPLLFMRRYIKGQFENPDGKFKDETTFPTTALQRNTVFFAGISVLLLVPLFKTVTHLPPFMGMLVGLGVMWIVTEIIHSDKGEEDRKTFSVAYALQKIDSPSILFFLGILLAIAALQSAGQLVQSAAWLDRNVKDENAIVICIGLLSSIVDNVPLVAASMGMYGMNQFPTDHSFWQFLAYCTGTGGSILIIGSAAGVAAMGMERINFFWYLKRIGWLALLGYVAGAIVYILEQRLFS